MSDLDWSKTTIEPDNDGYKAEMRGDLLINGDNGSHVTFVGWGDTAGSAQANLMRIISETKRHLLKAC